MGREEEMSVSLKLPKETGDALKRAATAQVRSIAGQTEFYILEGLRRDGLWPAADESDR